MVASLLRVGVVAAVLVALSSPSSALGQCTKDTDCKGDRICERGTCVNPPAKANASPAPVAGVQTCKDFVRSLDLKNGRLPIAGGRSKSIRLKDGSYERDDWTWGIALVASGDLDGDGVDDLALAVCGECAKMEQCGNGHGCGVDVYVTRPGPTCTLVPSGSKGGFSPEKMGIKKGKLWLQSLDYGPDDPRCCPTKRTLHTYRIEAGKLVEKK